MDESLGELIVRISADITSLKNGLAEANDSIVEFSDNGMKKIDKAQSEFGESVKSVGKGLETFGSQLRSIGRELNQLSGIFALAGGAGMAPFILALHNSQSSILSVNESLKRLTEIGQVFNETLAASVVPTINKLSVSLNGLLHWFLSIPEPIRQAIAQNILWNSAMLVGTGIVIKIAAEVVRFTSDVSKLTGRFVDWIGIMIETNPIMLAIGLAIGVLIALMIKFEDVGTAVMNTFEILFLSLKNGFLAIVGTIEKAIGGLYYELSRVYSFMAKLPGVVGTQFSVLSEGAKNLSNHLDEMANKSMQGVIVNAQKMGTILHTGSGQWANDFKDLKKMVEGFFEAFQKGSTNFGLSQKTIGDALNSSITVLGHLSSALDQSAAKHKSLANAAKAVAIGMAIMNAAQGITKIWAEWAAVPPVAIAFSALEIAATAIQISTIESQQFAEGTDTVPAMLSPGEMVIPSTFAGAIRRGDLSLSGREGAEKKFNINVTVNANVSHAIDIDTIGRQIGLNIEQKLRRIK